MFTEGHKTAKMTGCQQARPRAVILITLDALRADHLGCYGYPLPTTPFLDSLASESVTFEYAFSPIPLTTPAHASILTGKYPRFHSVGFHNGDQPLSKEQEVTLPQLLQQLGFKTAAFISIGTLLKQTGLNSGFDLYDDTLPQRELNRPAEPRRSADLTTSAALEWLEQHRDSPFFLWVHYGEPHGPYDPPPPYDSLFAGNQLYGAPRPLQTVLDGQTGGIPAYQVLKPRRDASNNLLDYEKDFTYYLSQYDGKIRFVDDQLKVLVDNLKEWGIYADALLIVTADHGEALGENDVFFFHGLTVSLEQLHVPLIIKPPSGSSIKDRRITEPVSTIDIMPTLLAWLGEEAQYLGIQGINLLPFLQDSRISLPRQYIFSEIPTQLSLIHGHFQLLYGKEKEDMPYPRVPAVEGVKLYNYIDDPTGKTDLSAQHPHTVATLKTVAESYLKIPLPSYTTEQLSPEDMAEIKARLKQLGYIHQDTKETRPLLEFTGERFLPWMEGAQIHYEHLHRYAFAAQFVKGKRVLDLACGEGYGAHMLGKEAEYVIGVEIDKQTVEHARRKYMQNNLEFIEGSILAVPIKGEKVFDVIVCFEAIEYVAEHDKLLSEVKWLLKEDGIFIVSTPNKALYSDVPGYDNPFHVKELYFSEFQELLKRYFNHIRIWGQCVYAGSNIWQLELEEPNKYLETVIKKGDEEFYLAQREKKEPMYFVALASDAPLEPPSWCLDSWLVDTSNILLHNYETQIAELNQTIRAKDAQIQQIQQGTAMQLVSRYQRIVEKLLPWGTRRRYYYELMLRGIRVILNEGWRSFWQSYKSYRNRDMILQTTLKPSDLTILPASSEEAIDVIDRRVAIIIPTKNAGEDFDFTLQRITSAKGIRTVDIVVVDSGSTDRTVQLARNHGVKVITIDPADFNPGLTRNFGASQVSGDYVLFMTQDAIPIGDRWLHEKVKVLESDTAIAAVTCRQVPRSDADLFACFSLWNHYRYLGFAGDVVYSPHPEFHKLPPLEKRRLIGLDNVCCLIRKPVFDAFKFRELSHAEDLDLGLRLGEQGYKIAFLQSVGVIHSHTRTASYEMRRSYVGAKLLPGILSYDPTPLGVGCTIDEVFGNTMMLYAALNASVQSLTSYSAPVERLFSELKSLLQENFSKSTTALKKFQRAGTQLDEIFDRIGGLIGGTRMTPSKPLLQRYLDALYAFKLYLNAYDTLGDKQTEFVDALFKLYATLAGTTFGSYILTALRQGKINQLLSEVDAFLAEGV